MFIRKHFLVDMVERPLCTCGTHIVWNRSRMSMLNNSCRNQLFYDLLSKVCLLCFVFFYLRIIISYHKSMIDFINEVSSVEEIRITTLI